MRKVSRTRCDQVTMVQKMYKHINDEHKADFKNIITVNYGSYLHGIIKVYKDKEGRVLSIAL